MKQQQSVPVLQQWRFVYHTSDSACKCLGLRHRWDGRQCTGRRWLYTRSTEQSGRKQSSLARFRSGRRSCTEVSSVNVISLLPDENVWGQGMRLRYHNRSAMRPHHRSVGKCFAEPGTIGLCSTVSKACSLLLSHRHLHLSLLVVFPMLKDAVAAGGMT